MTTYIRGEAQVLKDSIIKATKPVNGQKERWLNDANTCLVLRVITTSKVDKKGNTVYSRYWYHRYYVNGKRVRTRIGTYPDLSLSDARKKSKYWTPTEETAKTGVVSSGYLNMTVRDVIDSFLKKRRRKSTIETYTTLKNLYLTDEILDTKAASIEPIDAWNIIYRSLTSGGRKKKENPTPGSAQKLNALCSAAFANAMILEKVPHINPFKVIRQHDDFKTEITNRATKTRALTPEEIVTLWRNINKPNGYGTPSTARALMLILVTGQRPGEVTGMHRSEILPADEKGDVWWRIPAERIKTNCETNRAIWEDHDVYLSPLALKIIGDSTDFIFPGAKDEENISRSSLSKLVGRKRDNQNKYTKDMFLGLSKPWFPQDLRRTVQTTLDETLDCPAKYFNAILNHEKPTKIRAIYSATKYMNGKKLWLSKWSAWLEELLGEELTLNIRHTDPPKYDIQKLKELVRIYSKTKVAEMLGVSDRTIGVLCTKHRIDVPPRGYRFPHRLKDES